MENSLDLLLKYYEEEKRIAQEHFNELIKFEDYEIAAINLKYLAELKRTIGILKSFNDDLYYKRTRLEDRIGSLKKELADNPSLSLRLNYKTRLSDCEWELELMNLFPKYPAVTGNDRIISEALDKVIKKVVKGFILILHKQENISFEIKLVGNRFKITLLDLTRAQRYIGGWHYGALERLGFEKVTNRNRLRLLILNNNGEGISKFKTIFSRIVFEIFNFRDFDNESFIQYIQHNDRQ